MMARRPGRRISYLVVAVAVALALAGCGGDGSEETDRPSIVVTTTVLGDVVRGVVGDQADVEVVMPVGADPHDFAPSARQTADLTSADVIVANGGGFEASLTDVVDAARADGARVFEARDAVGSDADVHFFTDPIAMAAVVEGLGTFLAAEVPDLDPATLQASVREQVRLLTALDADVAELLAPVPQERRILVTNHDVFGPFATRYGFEVVGTVFPSGTSGGANARDLSALAALVRDRNVPAVFTDRSSSDDLARTLAAEAGDVVVVALFTESLGGPGSGAETYDAMVRTNAQRIADALAPGPG